MGAFSFNAVRPMKAIILSLMPTMVHAAAMMKTISEASWMTWVTFFTTSRTLGPLPTENENEVERKKISISYSYPSRKEKGFSSCEEIKKREII